MFTNQLKIVWYGQKIILLCVFIFIFLTGKSEPFPANEAELQSVLKKYPQNKHDSIYYEGFRFYLKSDIKMALLYAYKSFKISGKYGHGLIHSKSCHGIGYIYSNSNEIDSAILYLRQATQLTIKGNYKDRLVYLYKDLGRLYERIDVYDSALYYFNLWYDLADEVSLHSEQADAVHNIGVVYYHLGNYENALRYLEEDIKINDKIGRRENTNITLLNIAQIYIDQAFYNKAVDRLREVERNCKSGCDNSTLALLQYRLGFCKLKENQQKEAHDLLEKSRQLSLQSNSNEVLAHALFYLSFFPFDQGDYLKSLRYLNESKKVAETFRYRRLQRDIYHQLADVHTHIGELNEAIRYQRLYEQMKDSIFNETVANNIKTIELNEQKKESDRLVKQKENQIKESRLIAALVGVICILAFVVVLLLYKNSLVTKLQVLKRTIEREEMNQELSRSQLDFNYLVYRTSKDIRAPLAIISDLLNLLNKDTRNKELKTYVDQLQKEVSLKVNQLAELYEVRDQEILMEEIDINSLVINSCEDFNRRSKNFPTVSLITGGAWRKNFKTDKALLTQLITNGIRYFSRCGHTESIEISFDQSEACATISIMNRCKNDYLKVMQESIFDLFVAQITAWKLKGNMVLAEHEGYVVFKIILPCEVGDLKKDKMISEWQTT